MLSRRDKELAREIGFQVRHGGNYPPFANDIYLPGPVAWIGAALFGAFSYGMRDWHSLFWGLMLISAAFFLPFHAKRRELEEGSRALNIALFTIYGTAFWIALNELWTREYYILTFAMGLPALVTMVLMTSAVFKGAGSR